MKAILFSVFIFLNLLVFIMTQYNITQRIDFSLYTHLNNLKIHYNALMHGQETSADLVYDMLIKNKKAMSIISKAYYEENEDARDQLRNELIKELKARYKLIKNKGVLQFHILFPNNVTFLRMHKLHKFGDDLTQIRWDVAQVNETHEKLRGFAQGRTSHGFRNVYPLFDENNNHIGVVDVAFPSEILQKNLNLISKLHSHFIVKKSVFEAKSWTRDDLKLKYIKSKEHEDYLMSVSKFHKEHVDKNLILNGLKKVKDDIAENISKEKEFSLLLRHEDKVKITSFYPIEQDVTKEIVAWIVSYDDDAFVAMSLKDMKRVRTIAFIIFAILVYFLYRLIAQKKVLNNILASYDKNVISSRMNLKGLYTHVSKAFCKVSGYSKQELIGRESIIMDSITKNEFKDMKESIKHGISWKKEVRDKNKNGEYYWVDLEIEPIMKKNKVVGFSTIRQDITDRKDVEDMQKEIIFTMGSIGESRSKETANHVRRVALYSKLLAKYYGLTQDEVDILEQASPMHDIGKVAIPDAILNKPGKLDEQERIIIETHAFKGYSMLKHSNRKLLQAAAVVAYEHHEKWDGTGYPRGLKGNEIHIYGRITALADVFDALGSKRCYKEAWKNEEVFALLKQERGKHFDPGLIDIFFEHAEEFLAIRKTLED